MVPGIVNISGCNDYFLTQMRKQSVSGYFTIKQLKKLGDFLWNQ